MLRRGRVVASAAGLRNPIRGTLRRRLRLGSERRHEEAQHQESEDTQ